MIVREGAVYRRVRTVQLQAAVAPADRARNIRRAMLAGLPGVPLVPAHDRTMVLAGYGPSLAGKLDDLTGESGEIFTVSGAHDYLLAHDVVPHAHVECDARPHKARLLAKADARVVYLIASCCALEMFDAVRGQDVRVWHNAGSPEEDAAVRALDPGAWLVLGATTVGSRAISLGSALGYRHFVLYGFDASFAAGLQHAGSHPNEATGTDLLRVKLAGREFDTSAQMFKSARDFLWQVGQMPDCRFTLMGDGMLQHAVREMRIPRCTVIA